ncbi:MAG: hypothetical protein AUH85_00700 [Chloroflexi bacterium 13_1_40CM_4_68_4]|nr:MAG: hypothetical protein AUH85_00700 [Chloroflexi bacterium 13_1_40CM_4_68_4]
MIDVVLLTAPPPHGEITGGHRYNSAIAERAGRNGARMRVIALSGHTLAHRALAARRAFRESRRADAVVIDSIVGDAVALAGKTDLRLIGLAHQVASAGHPGPFGRVGQALHRAAYRRCALVIAVSDWVAAELGTIGVAHTVVHPGVDKPPILEPRNVHGPAVVLCVANWLAHKGILDLAEALSLLPADAATLHLVGAPHLDTRYGRRVAARIAREDLRARVISRGTLGRNEVAGEFAAADIFALPSRDEAYGIAFAEALASGLPVVGYRSGNAPALVGDGGILVDPGDIEGLAQALHLLALDPKRRLSIAAAARRRAATLSTWDQSASAFFAAVRGGMRRASSIGHDERDRTASSA